MSRRKKTEYVHVGQYVAAVEVSVIEDDSSWSPYLSLDDANKLDEVREALEQGDFDRAATYGSVYRLDPVA